MEPRCPRCTSTHLEEADIGGPDRRCRSCGARFPRDEALVRVLEAEAHAAEMAYCTCDGRRGCQRCFRRAEELVGQMVRDAFGREWCVISVEERDHFPTIRGEVHWDIPDDITVVGRR